MPDEIKQKVERFYNEVGWQLEANGLYQNAEYEDLRPVSADYIARAHTRVAEHLAPKGEYLLDAGSGPVQYAAYLKYSEGYKRRVCFDLSIVALQEARKKLGEKGFYVVGDIAHLPFKNEAFDGIVSLHTIHHLPMEEKETCYLGLYRCLKPGRSMVTVDGWARFGLAKLWQRVIGLSKRFGPREIEIPSNRKIGQNAIGEPTKKQNAGPASTFVAKNDARWFKTTFTGQFPFRILSWRSVSVHFLRSVIRSNAHGYRKLKVLSWFEDHFPRFFGENGQYPLIVISKPAAEVDQA
jgi:SAM-dependent methyltransferase